ncbi:molybdenum cofactor guanylyltransferase MobA [Methylobacterium sp. R2-1]|uniref:molybdenum cofactor guanylyltransferase MobA n=1 Tax=Methylobacterium sp. R2-1 TaxID=2587064 RepID=UPI001615F290|nr:molybdenum cofactor guanylyltransferase MobA [Methylobacterium sp. R2-1]MBB2963035.1 molybdopterin-guanine dinucleotide biosynthesis protein A [Methylobacterium sp. R2-1]
MSSAPVLGLILAGGLSRRMGGGDKPLRRLAGRTLLERVAERLRPQCQGGLVLSANGDPARFRDVFSGEILSDPVPDHPGPLAGILAGMEAAQPGITHVVSVPGDAPFLPHDFVARLVAAAAAEGKPIALAASGERRHFTSALWPVALRVDLRDWLGRGERRVGGFIERHGAAVASWPVAPVDPFLNLNAPEDLAAAEAILARLP